MYVLEENFYSLVTKLCERMVILGEEREERDFEHYLSKGVRERKKRKVIRKCKSMALTYILKKKPLKLPKTLYMMPVKDEITAFSYDLLAKGEETKSRNLRDYFHSLNEHSGRDLDAVLKLLLCLKNSESVKSISSLNQIGDCIDREVRKGHSYENYPRDIFIAREGVKEGLLKHYPKEMFNLPLRISLENIGSHEPTLGMDTVLDLQHKKDDSLGDEGYNSPTVEEEEEEEEEEDLWTAVLDTKSKPGLKCRLRTWQTLGQKSNSGHAPFLFESPTVSLHHLWSLISANLSLISPDYIVPKLRPIPIQQLCQDIGYLMAGIPSASFPYCQGSSSFIIVPGLCLDTLSPECLASLVRQYIEVGNTTRLLEALCCSRLHTGNIWGGFQTGLRSFLRIYVNSVVTLAGRFSTSLNALDQALQCLADQIGFLGRVCFQDSSPRLPSGVSLLSTLLDVSVHVSNKAIHLLLVSLLQASVGPYFRFLQTWLFSGELEMGVHQEFGLRVDPRYLFAQDIGYWQHSFSLLPIQGSSFLADIQVQVHKGGKSLALLKRICPNHYLAGSYKHLQPKFHLAVTVQAQVEMKSVCSEYEKSLRKVASELTVTLQQKLAKEEEERTVRRKLIMEKNREAAEKRKRELEMEKEERVERQRVLREDLQRQAEEVKERKMKEKEDKEAEDKRIEMEAEKMIEEVSRREAEDRARMEQFYARLEAEAETRERRAEWRMKRSHPELKAKRIALHRELTESLRRIVRSPEENTNLDADDVFLDDGESGQPVLHFGKDLLGNMTIRLEDKEGNVVTEHLEEFDTLTEDIKIKLQEDGFDSLPASAKAEVRASITSRKLKVTKEREICSPLIHNVPSRQQNKLANEKCNISHWYEERRSTGEEKTDDNGNSVDEADGRRKRNSSSNVPIERLLYPHRYSREEKDTFQPTKTLIALRDTSKPRPYTTRFPTIHSSTLQEMGGPAIPTTPADGQAFAPLTLILQNSILEPLRVQARLVDEALVTHLLVDCRLADHLVALRSYLFLGNGEFGRQLVLSLCELGGAMSSPGDMASQLHSHLWRGAAAPFLLSPTSLNRVLDSALAGTTDPLASHITFQLEAMGGGRTLGIPGLSLTYQPGWPANLLLTTETVAQYSVVLDFMLELRLATTSLELDWVRENLVVKRQPGRDGAVVHRIGLMRHEMMNFLRNLHAYVSCQVLEVSWHEFQDNLSSKVHCLDDLRVQHDRYLHRVLFRCLLNSKASTVMKIVTDIFAAITRFSGLVGQRLTEEGEQGQAWTDIQQQYTVFKEYSRFLYLVVGKLSARGYQPHLQDLLLRLNFNGYYDSTGS